MTLGSLPIAFALIENEPNSAADAALLEALPFQAPDVQAVALDMLLRRAHAPELIRIVGRFHEFDSALRKLIADRAGDFSTGLRGAISSPHVQDQTNAIEMIAEGGDTRTAYLLAEALGSRHAGTRKRAAEVLSDLTGRLLSPVNNADPTPPPPRPGERFRQADQLADALAEAVRRWDRHVQPNILRAAMWLGDRTESEIRRKLQDRRSTLGRALQRMLSESADHRSAGFVLRALAIQALRPAAVRAITQAQDDAFLAALCGESWLLHDHHITQGCHWVRIGPWCQRVLDLLPNMDRRQVAGAVRLLMNVGGTTDQRTILIRELIAVDRGDVRRAVTWRLVGDTGEISNRCLILLASRPGDAISRMASREVRRRLRRRRDVATVTPPATTGDDDPNEAFECCWNAFDELVTQRAADARTAMRNRFPDIPSLIHAKLTSPQAFDRARALRLAAATGLVEELDDAVRDLAHDPDSIVRSSAVGMLDRLPGRKTTRLLRMAVNDPDDRVQANAIEVLDKLDVTDRKAFTEPKLESTNGRVRANAIKSLLRLELPAAGESLLNMLEDRSVAHRLSALWVINRLRLLTAADRLEQLCRDDPSIRVRKRAKHVYCELFGRQGTTFAQSDAVPTESALYPIGVKS